MPEQSGCIAFNSLLIGARVQNGRVDIYDTKTGYSLPNLQRYTVSYDYRSQGKLSVTSVTILCYMGCVRAQEPFSLTITADGIEAVED